MLRYSEDAELFMKFTEVTCNEFENWFLNMRWAIGTADIFRYLKAKDNNNLQFNSNFNEILIKGLVISNQAKIVLKCIKVFDEMECKKWYANNFKVSRESITDYIVDKKVKSNIIIPKIVK